MRESFNEYKKTLESNLVSIDYLFSGDVISSVDMSYSELKMNKSTSPSLIINCFEKIYKESFDILKSKSSEIVITQESLTVGDVDQFISRVKDMTSLDYKYFFMSNKAFSYMGFVFHLDEKRSLPGYFYRMTSGNPVTFYFSPEIKDDDDTYIIYASDLPFQSLVYGIQNMDYSMIPVGDVDGFSPSYPTKWKHVINYKLYDCKFSSVKIDLRSISKIRDEKIKQILK